MGSDRTRPTAPPNGSARNWLFAKNVPCLTCSKLCAQHEAPQANGRRTNIGVMAKSGAVPPAARCRPQAHAGAQAGYPRSPAFGPTHKLPQTRREAHKHKRPLSARAKTEDGAALARPPRALDSNGAFDHAAAGRAPRAACRLPPWARGQWRCAGGPVRRAAQRQLLRKS